MGHRDLSLACLCIFDQRIFLFELLKKGILISNLGIIQERRLLLILIVARVIMNLLDTVKLYGSIMLVDDCFVVFDRHADNLFPDFFSLVLVAE